MSNVNVTVLKDETLSAAGRVVEREYNEVKRAANVGELVKSKVDYPNIFTVTRVSGTSIYGGDDGLATFLDNYVVLAPTDTVRINSERFRMVDRKAVVGELVIVTSINGPNATGGRYYKTGNIAKVITSFTGSVRADLTQNVWYYKDGEWNIDREDYRVLEPLNTPLSSRPAAEQSAEIIATLTAEVESLKKRVSALEAGAKVRPATDAEVAQAVRKVKRGITAAEVNADLQTYAKESRQRKRDRIVERAKADVKAFAEDNVEFIVNKDKRTVVVLRRNRSNKRVISRGVAKCVPGDVFNAWIGKAIAAYRMFDLDVPAEYLSVPSPTEVRVGDVVYTACDYGNMTVADKTDINTKTISVLAYGVLTANTEYGSPRIIDDTREEVAA